MTFFSGITLRVTPLSATLLKYVSMNNQESKRRPKIVNVNGDEPVFYLFRIETSKCSSSFNNINAPKTCCKKLKCQSI